MSRPEEFRNAYSMLSKDSRFLSYVRIGDVDISSSVKNASFNYRINEIPSGRIVIDAGHPAVLDIDWRRPVTYIQHRLGRLRPVFTGDITSVTAQGSELVAQCSAMAAMNESIMGAYLGSGDIGKDLIYATLRDSGVSEGRIDIQLGNAPFEVFEVVVPIGGVSPISSSVRIGNVVLTSDRDRLTKYATIPDSGINAEFGSAPVYAITYQSSCRMHDAEIAALYEINFAASWLLARSRYSLAALPDMTKPDWLRESTLADPRVSDIVSVRGLLSGRSWIRVTSTDRLTPPLRVDQDELGLLRPLPSHDLPINVRRAMTAFTRAVREHNPITKVAAIWDSIEFYAGSTKVPDMFTKGELRAMRRAISKDLQQHQKARIADLIAQLNSAPLLTRLRTQIALDGVPIVESDFTLLASLRKIRNDVVHGRRVQVSAGSDEIEQGISIVARILLHASTTDRGSHGLET